MTAETRRRAPWSCEYCPGTLVVDEDFIAGLGLVREARCHACHRKPSAEAAAERARAEAFDAEREEAFAGKERRRQPSHRKLRL